MSPFDHDAFDSLDDELRRVTLPAGLLAGLRRIAGGDDAELDRALRDVALPDDLLVRLREMAIWSDRFIDHQLKYVPLPSGLLSRLSAVPDDALMEAELIDVPVPDGLLAGLREFPLTARPQVVTAARRRRSQGWQTAAAAALIVVISLSYLTAIAGFISTAYRDQPDTIWPLVVHNEPIRLDMSTAAVGEFVAAANATPEVVEDIRQVVVSWSGDEEFFVTTDMLPYGPVDDLEEWFGASIRSGGLLDPVETASSPLAAAMTHDAERPRVVAEFSPRGVTPHWKDRRALLFQYRHGVHPFLSPASTEGLRYSRVPLITAADSYEWAWDQLLRAESGQISRREFKKSLADQVRTEEFLQALDYKEPKPAAGLLGVRAYGGPSPFGAGCRLLQVIVQAGDVPAAGRRPTHLTVLVDVAVTRRGALGLVEIQQALHSTIDRLGPRDTLALIMGGERPHLLIDEAGKKQAIALHQAVELLAARDTFDFAAGVRLVAAIAGNSSWPSDNQDHRILLITDGVGDLTAETERQAGRQLGDLAARGVDLQIVDLANGRAYRDVLRRLAAAGHGRLVETGDRAELDWALREAIDGRSSVVARNAKLTVRFNPSVVSEYRLMGHEATSILGVVTAPIGRDLRGGQSGTGLFELRLNENGISDPTDANLVGWAELSWQDPGSGEVYRRRQRISRLQFASTFAEASLPLQAAAIVAETAELLRGSPYADRSASSFAVVQSLGREVDEEMRRTAEFQRLMRFLRRAAAVGFR